MRANAGFWADHFVEAAVDLVFFQHNKLRGVFCAAWIFSNSGNLPTQISFDAGFARIHQSNTRKSLLKSHSN
jgi:hypothetical protein